MTEEPVVEINPEAIPDELKERDQWLLWDARAHKPKQPHWDGDHHEISWSEPDDWHSFEEAVEKAESEPAWGIGYVTAADNHRHARGIYGVIDIDGGAEEDGTPKEWVPSLAPFFDRGAYTEWSVSKSLPEKYIDEGGDNDPGIHIPVAGFDVPDWWSDTHLTPDEHEGVDVLTNKFCTFTGDAEGPAGEEVVDYGEWVDEWLADAYEALNDEPAPPRQNQSLSDASSGRDGGDNTSYDGEVSRETVEEALEAIPGTQHFNDWIRTGYAVYSWDNGATGKQVFEEWSRENPKWEEQESQRQIDYIWSEGDDDGDRDNNASLGTLFYLAQNHGWEPAGPPGWKELIAEHSDEFDSGEEVPDDLLERDHSGEEDYGTEKAVADGAGAVTESGGDEEGTDPAATGLSPASVALKAYNDPNAQFLDGEEEPPAVADLKVGQRAYYTWKVAEEVGVGDKLLAVNQGGIYAYDSGVWDDEYGRQRLREIGGEALRHEYSSSVLDELEEQVRRFRTHAREELGVPEGVVAVENGLLDLDGRTTRELTPDDLAIRRLPVEFDPEAECPRWEQFIDETVPARWHDAIQEYVGYCLCIGRLPIHRALMLVGGGANGKGVFLDTVQALLGEENVGNKSLQKLAGDEHARAELFDKVANIDNDLSSRSLDVGMFKKTTGNDYIDARELYQEGFQYRATFKQLYAANQVPDVPPDGLDDAFFRRWLIIEFPEHFPKGSEKRDPRLGEKLSDELPGILNWALDGRDRLLEQGYFTNETAQDTRQRWRTWGDSISQFIEEHVVEAEDSRITASELYNAYATYCREELDQSPEPQQTVTSTVKGETGATYKQSLRTPSGHSSGFDGLRVSYDPDDGGSSQSGLGDVDDSRKVVEKIVADAEPQHDAGVPEGVILERAAGEGWDEKRTRDAIDRCLRSGIIQEPAEGQYRTV